MSLTNLSPVACVSDPSSYYCYFWTNHNHLTTSLANLGLNWGPLVRTLFVYLLKSPLLLFLRLIFLHQQESNPKVVDLIQFFALVLKFGNFKISL